jgi:hypothetical protein
MQKYLIIGVTTRDGYYRDRLFNSVLKGKKITQKEFDELRYNEKTNTYSGGLTRRKRYYYFYQLKIEKINGKL